MSVRLQSNGDYWQAVWTDTRGRRVVKSLGPKARYTKRAAMARCVQLAAGHVVAPGSRDAGKAPTLGAWADAYLALRADLSPGSLMLLRGTVAYLRDYFGEATRLDRITEAAADDWAVWLAAEKGHAASTVCRHVRTAKTMFRRAVTRRHLGADPFSGLSGTPPEPEKAWAYVTPAQLETILEACPSPDWRCLFALARLAGLRRGEAMRLAYADVDWKARTMTVEAEGGVRTTKARRRVVPIAPRLYDLLMERFEGAAEGEIRFAAVPTGNLQRNALAILRRAGVGAYSKPFHTLRKNRETDWLAEVPAVMSVCEWLGHSPTVAARHYNRTKAETLAEVTGKETDLDRMKAENARLRTALEKATSTSTAVSTTWVESV